jgi:CHRD domain
VLCLIKEHTMKTRNISIWAITTLAVSLLAAPAAHSQTERFSANLVGANEVPSINTAGSGEFRMQIVGSDINFSLSFSDLSSNLTAAHLHFAASKVAGGVMIFLCGGGGQPDCPAVTSGTITGTITAANVVGPTTQGIDVGDLDSALEVLRAGLSYANMHTVNFAGGEIRGQVRGGFGQDRGE